MCQSEPGIVVILLDRRTLLNIKVGVEEELPRELGLGLRRTSPAPPRFN